MQRSFLPLLLLCGTFLTVHGQAAPLTPVLPEPLSTAAFEEPAATVRLPGAAIRALGVWQAGQPLAPADAQRLADALLREGSEPLGVAFPAGTTTLVLQLDHPHALRRCQLVNLNTRDGVVALATSTVQLPPESHRWHLAAGGSQALGDAREDVVVRELELSADARYVRIEITLPQPGRIASLGLFERVGERRPTVEAPHNHMLPTSRPLVASLSFNSQPSAAGSHAASAGQVVMVSVGEDLRAAGAMIDGDLASSYTFRATGGRGALTVFDLGRRAAPGRLTVSYRCGGTGRVDAYLLDELPARGEVNAVRQVLAGRTADASAPLIGAVATSNGPRRGLQRAGLTLGASQGRYLALVFVAGSEGETMAARPGDPKDFKDRVDGKDFTGSQPALGDRPGTDQTSDRGLQVVEITASGTDRFGPLLTSVGDLTSLPGSPGAPPGLTFAPGSFFSPAGNFTSVNPGVDSAAPLLPVNLTTPEITP